MKIPDTVYATLTPIERIRAAVSATARNDDKEVEKLKTTCPRRIFSITDPDYSERMSLIMSVLLSTESDLRGLALNFLAATQLKLPADEIDDILEWIATLHSALRLFAAAEGIDFAELESCGPPRNFSVASLVDATKGRENAEKASEIAAMIREYVDQS